MQQGRNHHRHRSGRRVVHHSAPRIQVRLTRGATKTERTNKQTRTNTLKITITRPTGQHRIITDMQALAESVRLGNRIIELDATADSTEAEASERRKEQDAIRKQLDSLLKSVEHRTLVVTLRGLNSSQWAQITLKNSRTVQGRVVKDLPAIAKEAAPLMMESAEWADGDDVEFTGEEFSNLIDSMTDSQVNALMQTVQELNTPVVEIPKELTRLA